MTIRLWIDTPKSQRSPAVAGLLAELRERGLELTGCDASPRGMGLVLFDESNEELCQRVRERDRLSPGRVLAVCPRPLTSEDSWSLIQSGAADVLCAGPGRRLSEEILARLSRWDVIDSLAASAGVRDTLVGESAAWRELLRQVIEVARFTDNALLILGESGTGKERIARLVHALDARERKGDLVILDCSTIVPELAGSEFFGHERGAFTGAVAARDGAFALADGGTLFLDEVGELPLHLQVQLLRVIQEQTYKRVGGNTWQRASFRLVCATNRDLSRLVRRGAFRPDLYYRLAVSTCRLPALRDRPDDILPLARHFLRELAARPAAVPEIEPAVAEYLLNRAYPGNVRDLRQVVARLLSRYPGNGPITVGCIPGDERRGGLGVNRPWDGEEFERAIRRALALGVGLKGISRTAEETAIRVAVGETEGNLQQAALRLRVTDRTLQLRRAARRHDA